MGCGFAWGNGNNNSHMELIPDLVSNRVETREQKEARLVKQAEMREVIESRKVPFTAKPRHDVIDGAGTEKESRVRETCRL